MVTVHDIVDKVNDYYGGGSGAEVTPTDDESQYEIEFPRGEPGVYMRNAATDFISTESGIGLVERTRTSLIVEVEQ